MQKFDSVLPRLLSRLILVGFLFFVTIFGACIAGVCTAEPDTCFLLALGRWIVEHHQIPTTDPFSYTFALSASGQPLIVYQWLTELIFYFSVALSGPVGLVVLTALMLTLAYVIIPLRIFQRTGTAPLVALSTAALLMLSALRRASSRPELFSYFFLALFLELAVRLQLGHAGKDGPDKRTLLIVAISMVVWCNLHTGFVSGILFICLALIAASTDLFILKRRGGGIFKTWLFALPLSIAASLCNPYGLGLWRYLPNLFFAPVNATINELHPISPTAFMAPLVIPYTILILVCLASQSKSFAGGKAAKSGSLSLALTLVGLYLPFQAARLIAFSALLLSTGLALQSSPHKDSDAAQQEVPPSPGATQSPASILSQTQREISHLLEPLSATFAASALVFAGAGAALLSLYIVPTRLPMKTLAFHPPLGAVAYLKEHWQHGNLFNDPHFGDVIMWQMQPSPPLYIDSRYDIYSKEVQDDYWRMLKAGPEAVALLDKYKVEWIILPPQAELVQKLSVDWLRRYADEDCVVLEKAP